MSLGENIKKYRKAAKLTQLELAEKANLSRSYLADVENDRYNPSLDTLKSIANALNVSIHSLMDESQKEIPSWATKKDIRDFKKMLESEDDLMFDGVPLDEDDRQRIMDVLTGLFWEAKEMNKKTWGKKRGKKKKTDNNSE